MFDVIGSLDLSASMLQDASVYRLLPPAPPPPALPVARSPRAQVVQMLSARRFVYAGEDAMGLPCFRSPTGAILIAVGSTRCLAYAKVRGKLQVVAAARTTAILCRIAPESQTDRTSFAAANDDGVLLGLSPQEDARLTV